jgi:hypothetical protein
MTRATIVRAASGFAVSPYVSGLVVLVLSISNDCSVVMIRSHVCLGVVVCNLRDVSGQCL